MLAAAAAGELLGQLHDAGHAVGVGQQRIQFFVDVIHTAASLVVVLLLKPVFQPLYQLRSLWTGQHL